MGTVRPPEKSYNCVLLCFLSETLTEKNWGSVRLLRSALRGSTNIRLPTSLQFLISIRYATSGYFIWILCCLGWYLVSILVAPLTLSSLFLNCECATWQDNNLGRYFSWISSLCVPHRWFLNVFRRKVSARCESSTLLMFLRLEENIMVVWLQGRQLARSLGKEIPVRGLANSRLRFKNQSVKPELLIGFEIECSENQDFQPTSRFIAQVENCLKYHPKLNSNELSLWVVVFSVRDHSAIQP